jgi:outer membrane protein TolC
MTRALVVTSVLLTLVAAAPSVAQAPVGQASMAGAPDSTMRLDDVVAAALRHSPAVAQAAGAVRIGESGQRVATGTFLPSVTFNSAATNSNERLASGTTGTTGNVSHTDNYYAGLAGSVDVFTGGRRGALVAAARATTRSADASRTEQTYAVTLVADSTFYAAQRARELVDVAGTTVDNADRNLQYATAMLRNGTATRADVLQAQFALTTARQQLIAAHDTLIARSYALGRLVGINGAVGPHEGDSLPPVALALNDATLLGLAPHDVPSVRAADQFALASHETLRATRTEYIPDIKLTGGYDWANQSAISGAVRPGYFVSVGTSFPLFNGFVREDDIERASVADRVAHVQATDQQRFAFAEIARLLTDTRAAWDAIGQATEGVRVATEEVRVMTVRYQAGVATFLDLTTAQLNDAQAGVALATARYAYLVARASLEALVGRPL